MPNRNYANGRAWEYEIMELLRSQGYQCSRASGSHGLWDVIAWDAAGIMFIQAKRDCRPSKAEIGEMLHAIVPENASKWVYIRRARKPAEKIRLYP